MGRRASRRKRAANAIASHSDLLCEILVRLPPETLLKLRSVCRQWHDLISSQLFRLQHTRRYGNPRPTGMFFRLPNRDLNFDWKSARLYHKNNNYRLMMSADHALCKLPDSFDILCSCNGLLLCSEFVRPSRQYAFDFRYFYVCNPTTMQAKIIPIEMKKCWNIHFKFLAFDPSMPEKYRVVLILLAGKSDGHGTWSYDVDVYESETSAWRHCATFSTGSYMQYHMHRHGVYWNGAVYWLGFSRVFLFSFDLNQERFRESLLPPMIDNGDIEFHLGPSQGHLYLFSFDRLEHVRVYQMEQDHSHFSMKVSIRHNHHLGTRYSTPANQFTIFMGEDDKLFVLLPRDGIVFIYDIKNPNSAPVRTIFPRELLDNGHCVCYYYSESLSPV